MEYLGLIIVAVCVFAIAGLIIFVHKLDKKSAEEEKEYASKVKEYQWLIQVNETATKPSYRFETDKFYETIEDVQKDFPEPTYTVLLNSRLTWLFVPMEISEERLNVLPRRNNGN